MKVLQGILSALALLTLAVAAPRGMGLGSASAEPVAREPGDPGQRAGAPSRGRYVFVGGFSGGK